MGDMHDAWFFIGVLVFIFLIWAATGGPLHPLAFTGPRLATPDVLGGGTYLSFPRAPFGIGGATISAPGGSPSDSSYSSGYISSGVFGNPSPYRNIVTMNHSVTSAGAANPKNEYLTISVSGSATVPVDLSGWTLESDATGNAAPIPKGTEIPASGTINQVQDVVLSPGERAIIISGQSPIGASFRENKCIGYFSTFQTFTPSLPQNCPTPSSELSANTGAAYIRDASCIDYVQKLSRCQVQLSPPVSLSGTCQSFLIKYLNYNGCVDAHRNDSDFEGSTWRIYLGRASSMWRTKHELVKLLDAQGKTVDAFTY